MICAVIEFHVRAGAEDAYDEWAERLHAKVHEIDGFLSVERFNGHRDPTKRLSLSYWRDAAALKAWRDDPDHLKGMAAGKREIFADYRIVIAEVARDYSFQARVRK